MNFSNVYDDKFRAESYSRLEFPGTYYLAYRDLPGLISKFVKGKRALDFGCGTGRSVRFLKNLGFEVTGIDISANMVSIAKELDPEGEYHHKDLRSFAEMETGKYDLITGVFTFDNIPGKDERISLLNAMKGMLSEKGTILLVDSTPEIYMNEWLSFSTADYPENRNAKSGEKVKIVMKDVEDKRPVEDIIWFPGDYYDLFNSAGLQMLTEHKTFGKPEEEFEWKSEKDIAPWVVYVLQQNT
ncbi:MAG: class I SAM-dependent methyltransferase [Ignavibacteria bacterium]|nr:class I SAM-dependent methyltransferase [Ignavibacteria bacterium]